MQRVQETYTDFSLAEDLLLWPRWRDAGIADQKKIAQHRLAGWYWPACELLRDRTVVLCIVFYLWSMGGEGAVLACFSKQCGAVSLNSSQWTEQNNKAHTCKSFFCYHENKVTWCQLQQRCSSVWPVSLQQISQRICVFSDIAWHWVFSASRI